MKLLLRVRPDLADIENGEGQTALEIAREMGNDTCVELLTHAIAGKTELFENVNIDWNLISVCTQLFQQLNWWHLSFKLIGPADIFTDSFLGSAVL